MDADLALTKIASAKRGSLMAAVACFVSATLAVAAPFLPHVFDVLLAGSIVAATVCYFALRPKTGRFDYFEVLVPYSIIYFLNFGVGALFLKARPEYLYSNALIPYLTPALALGVVGYLTFLGGYGWMATRTPPSRIALLLPRGVTGVLTLGILGFVGFVAGATRIAAGVGGAVSPLIPLIAQVSPVYYFAWYLLWHIFWSKEIPRTTSLLLFLIFVPGTVGVMYLSMGQKTASIVLMSTPAIAYWYAKRKLPVKTIAVVLLIAVTLVFPIYNAFRLQSRTLSIGQRLDRTVDVARRWSGSQYAEESIVAFFSRFAIISAPTAVLRDAGRWVDFKYGETLLLAPISLFIPRILWPDKPTIAIGHEFARTFNLLAPGDRETFVAITPVGELYWNFQVPGVVVGMFLVGWLYRWLFMRYGHGSEAGPYRKATYLTVLFLLLTGEGNLAILGASIVKQLLLIHGVLWLFLRVGWARYSELPTPTTSL